MMIAQQVARVGRCLRHLGEGSFPALTRSFAVQGTNQVNSSRESTGTGPQRLSGLAAQTLTLAETAGYLTVP